ncbi:MAG: phosphoglucosamine mutase, partial [Actinobacteria bacterium]|nr:phosphoglucosamine mutase [Actinomycetota bacterium]
MKRLFGTDGVRGVANKDLTPDLVLALGRAAASVGTGSGGRFVVGRDTRTSGPMLEAALVAGLCSAGADVLRAGIVPTPAVAFLTVAEAASGGAAISASHNPVRDNGIKFFSREGLKISEETELQIETAATSPDGELPIGTDVGTAVDLDDADDLYVDHLLRSLPTNLDGLRVVLDCAYGAAFQLAPRAFREAGADVHAIHAEPDGSRINVDCGSTSMTELSRVVVSEGADLGLAFDGDADRVLAVDERGEEVDGDRILGLLALRLMEDGELKDGIVVATVMSNLGFVRALEERGIEVIAAPVGDKFVVMEMAQRGAVLGGEQSGHVILAKHSTTGDGILTGLQTAAVLKNSDLPLSKLAHFFEPFPQVLVNVEVADRDGLANATAVWDAVAAAEAVLGDEGRVLLRPSGTEPLVRVMV